MANRVIYDKYYQWLHIRQVHRTWIWEKKMNENSLSSIVLVFVMCF